eukprot:12094_4
MCSKFDAICWRSDIPQPAREFDLVRQAPQWFPYDICARPSFQPDPSYHRKNRCVDNGLESDHIQYLRLNKLGDTLQQLHS